MCCAVNCIKHLKMFMFKKFTCQLYDFYNKKLKINNNGYCK